MVMAAPVTDVHVLIPCKRFGEGKSRLAPALSLHARRSLCGELLRRTIAVARQIAPPGRLWLTTADEDAAAIARGSGIVVIPDIANDLNRALHFARDEIRTRSGAGLDALMVMPIDLPLAAPAALRPLVASDAAVAIAADRRKSGTNLLRLKGTAATGLDFAFGRDSLASHCAQAQRHGYSLTVSHDPRLAFDLDEIDDLAHLPVEFRYAIGVEIEVAAQ